MISNEQRRETAKELRNQLKYMRMRAEWYNEERDLVECGNSAYRNIAHSVDRYSNMYSGYYIHIVEQLAELIDRPTYRPVIPDEMEGNVFCPQCGAEIGEYGVPNYCHNCGAAIRND